MLKSETILNVDGLVKSFAGRVVVNEVNLEVPEACSFGYLGPNGAGKTTLMRVILGLTPKDKGTVRIGGLDAFGNRREALSQVGAIIEEPRFHKNITALANLEIMAAARGGDAYKRISESLDMVELLNYAKVKVGTYSMGMRQRLGIAACLLGDPKLLLLDEPMNGLDPAGMNALRDLIQRLVEEGRSVLLSSHLLDEVQKTCQYVAILDDGKVVIQGALNDIIAGGNTDVLIECNDPQAAFSLLANDKRILNCHIDDAGISYSVATDTDARQQTGEANRLLVENQITVYGIIRSSESLEKRFLELTKKLGEQTFGNA